MDDLTALVRQLLGDVLGPGLSDEVADMLAGRLANVVRAHAVDGPRDEAGAVELLRQLADAEARGDEYGTLSDRRLQLLVISAITSQETGILRLYATWRRARAVHNFKQACDALLQDWGDVWDELEPAPPLVCHAKEER